MCTVARLSVPGTTTSASGSTSTLTGHGRRPFSRADMGMVGRGRLARRIIGLGLVGLMSWIGTVPPSQASGLPRVKVLATDSCSKSGVVGSVGTVVGKAQVTHGHETKRARSGMVVHA